MQHWQDLFHQLHLNKTDAEIVRKFLKDPFGKAFLPAAEVLKRHDRMNEALELLTYGLSHHPQYSVARVVLSRDLLQTGNPEAAEKILKESPVSLRENLLAQKIKLKCVIIRGDEQEFKEILKHLFIYKLQDEEITQIQNIYHNGDFLKVQTYLHKQCSDLGITFTLREPPPTLKGYIPPKDLDKNDLSGFHVMPLESIFSESHGAHNLEVDSLKLAEIYEHQGMYAKSLSIYKRLIATSPDNDYLRKKMRQLQDTLDLEGLPPPQSTAKASQRPLNNQERVETLDHLTEKIKFLNHMLHKLN